MSRDRGRARTGKANRRCSRSERTGPLGVPSGSDPSGPSLATPVRRPGGTRPSDRQRLRAIIGAASIAIVAVLLAGALLLGRSNAPTASALTDPNALNPAPRVLSVGSPAPDFDLATLDGQRIRLSGLRGHPVVLEFFAIWCPHCQNEAPVLNQIDSAFASRGVRTLAILANPYGRHYDTSGGTDRRPADRADLTWYETTFKVQYPTLIDPSFATVNRYGASSYPTIYVIDGQGVIRFVQAGEVPYQTLANILTGLQ